MVLLHCQSTDCTRFGSLVIPVAPEVLWANDRAGIRCPTEDDM